jgi:hypothetical protein
MNILERVLFNLETISNISRGQKISTAKEFIVLDDYTITQGFWRWKNAESRDKAIFAICKEVRTVIFIALCILESKYISNAPENADQALIKNYRIGELKKIQDGLSYALNGVNNICFTYENDADVTGRLRPLLTEMTDCVASISKMNTASI